jgi:hypothetical protein
MHVLSNGRLSVLANARGDGGSRWRAFALTRWAPDRTFDADGFHLYLTDARADGEVWSVFRERDAEPPRVVFAPHVIERDARRGAIAVREQISVAADADVEIRHLTVGNDSGRRRRLRLTGYVEGVLGDAAADRRHPAFSKMFVESEYVADENALVSVAVDALPTSASSTWRTPSCCRGAGRASPAGTPRARPSSAAPARSRRPRRSPRGRLSPAPPAPRSIR